MQIKKKGLFNFDSAYKLQQPETSKKYTQLKTKTQKFISTEQSNINVLKLYKTSLQTGLANKIADIQELDLDQMANKYLPFIFRIQRLPPIIISVLAAKGLSIKYKDIGQLSKFGDLTVKHQALKVIQKSLAYGGSEIQQAISALNQSAVQTAIKTIANLYKNLKATLFKDINQDASYDDGLQKKILTQFLKMLRPYGTMFIDYYYLTKFCPSTKVYGRPIMFSPQVPSMLFELQFGIPKVYTKTSSAINLIQQNIFNERFLMGICKGIQAERNAAIISKYNTDVSDQKSSFESKKDKFLKDLKL